MLLFEQALTSLTSGDPLVPRILYNLAYLADADAKEAKEALGLINRSLTLLRDGKPARFVDPAQYNGAGAWACAETSAVPISAIFSTRSGAAAAAASAISEIGRAHV